MAPSIGSQHHWVPFDGLCAQVGTNTCKTKLHEEYDEADHQVELVGTTITESLVRPPRLITNVFRMFTPPNMISHGKSRINEKKLAPAMYLSFISSSCWNLYIYPKAININVYIIETKNTSKYRHRSNWPISSRNAIAPAKYLLIW